jgi:hypothetical protein
MEELSLGASAIADATAAEEVTDVPAAAPSPGGSGRQAAPPAVPAAPATPAKDRQIEFLCPNGHHLHGPATLQGRAGECPECGSRFRIPVVDEPEALPEPLLEPQLAAEPELAAEEEITLEGPPPLPAAHAEAADVAEPLGFLQVLDGPGSGMGRGAAVGAVPAELLGHPADVVGAQIAHPLAALFVELWAARDEGSRVEVHLESGSVLQPDAYVKSHSLQDYAVLVTKDPDGCSTVTIVPWNSIARIILRALKQVPGEVVR